MNNLELTRAAIERHLQEVATHFRGDPKITLLVRNDVGLGLDADFLMTNDTLADAIAGLQRRAEQGV